jgi:prophage regulatory protein
MPGGFFIWESQMAFIDLAEVMRRSTLGKSTIYAYVKDGKFPAPVKLGDRAVGWVEEEVAIWLEERIKASRQAA